VFGFLVVNYLSSALTLALEKWRQAVRVHGGWDSLVYNLLFDSQLVLPAKPLSFPFIFLFILYLIISLLFGRRRRRQRSGWALERCLDDEDFSCGDGNEGYERIFD